MHTPKGISVYSFQIFLLKTISLLVFVTGFFTQQVLAQFTDDFTDGDFLSSPAWSGSTSKFVISSGQLRLMAPAVSGDGYLSTPSRSIDSATWEFFVRMDFNPSSTNYASIYLTSDQANLAGPLNGYFVMLGNVNDEISLYKQSGTTKTKIIDGTDGKLNLALVTAMVRVTRDADGNWELLSDVGSTGSFTSEGFVADLSTMSSQYSGVYCLYSSTRSDKFYFDNFVVQGDPFTDNVPPALDSLKVLSSSKLQLSFSEEVSATAENTDNYMIEGSHPDTAMLQPDRKTVLLQFAELFPNGIETMIHVSGVTDTAGNVMVPIEDSFLFFQPSAISFKDIVITEIFPDYEPVIGLPGAEYLEILNRSIHPIDLSNWKITDGSSTGVLGSRILQPGSYLILCSTSNASLFSGWGACMGVSNFPTLNNSSDRLRLRNADDLVVDSVNYSSSWYGDDDKRNGGYSLELIDPDNFCLDERNWKSSQNEMGGTPGIMNSVFQAIIDLAGPRVASVSMVSDSTVRIQFDEKLQSEIPVPGDFSIDPSLDIAEVHFTDETKRSLDLLTSPVEPGRMYTMILSGIKDCAGNLIEPGDATAFLNPDSIPPNVDSVAVTSATEVTIFLSEKIDPATASRQENYFLGETGIHPAVVSVATDQRSVSLRFSDPFDNGASQILVMEHAEDINGNFAVIEAHFVFFQPSPVRPRDIIITEIFPDPLPMVGLPEAEFIEIYNRSPNPVNVEHWTITDRSTVATMPYKILLPGDYVVVTSKSNESLFSDVAQVIALNSFPTLNNTRDTLVVKDASRSMIDSVVYQSTFYQDEDKKEGGWTLERINPEDVCREEENWAASQDVTGGTPGRQNSVFAIVHDTEGPKVSEVDQPSPALLHVLFNEKTNMNLPDIDDVRIEPPKRIQSLSFEDPRTLAIKLEEPLENLKTYLVSVRNIFDCPGNLIQAGFTWGFVNPDSIPPAITGINVISQREIQLLFSEALNDSVATDIQHYSLQADSASPTSVNVDSTGSIVTLLFARDFQNGVEETVSVSGMEDVNGNVADLAGSFMFFMSAAVYFKDVIITEILADPFPVAGLPESEFVEIFNRSENPVNIAGWKFGDGSAIAEMPAKIILPREYLILCPASAALAFSPHGRVLGLRGFPALNNSGEPLTLKDASGGLIDSVNFSDSWFLDDELMEGGYSLELIDVENTCAEAGNWIGSLSESGGTPGKQNSVYDNKPDQKGPELYSINVESQTRIKLWFNEKLEQQLPDPQNFLLVPDVGIEHVSFSSPTLTGIDLWLSESLRKGVEYAVTANNVRDCAGNMIDGEASTLTFAVPESPGEADLVINEILFNPHPDGVDFIEIYNRSEKFIDIRDLSLANFGDSLLNFRPCSEEHFLMRPESYLVFTSDADVLSGQYPRGDPSNYRKATLPSMNDDEGTIALVGPDRHVIDRLAYSRKMHSLFIKDEEGISLERISFEEPTEALANWKSASGTSGFATPGLRNSNSVAESSPKGRNVTVVPEVFQPLSGVEDFTRIFYLFEKGGYVANVNVFDSGGRLVRKLVDNEIIGTEGFFRWDGDEEGGTKARIGYYMIRFEVFDETGSLRIFRERVSIAGRF